MKPRSWLLFIAITGSILATAVVGQAVSQSDVDYMGRSLDVQMKVVSNLNGNDLNFNATIIITNTGDVDVQKSDWEIFFYCIYIIEPKGQVLDSQNGYQVPGTGISIFHVEGGLFKMAPNQDFQVLVSRSTLVLELLIQNWSVSRTDWFPNWYVASPGLEPRLLTSSSDVVDLVADFAEEEQYKRYEEDRYRPSTTEERYHLYELPEVDPSRARKLVLPEPVYVEERGGSEVRVRSKRSNIQCESNHEDHCARFKRSLGIEDPPLLKSDTAYTLILEDGEVDLDFTDLIRDQSYQLITQGTTATITAPTSLGMYYGQVTFANLIDLDEEGNMVFPSVLIKDAPRFEYRGFVLDVARNFRTKEEVIKLLQTMGRYKLNKLHLHLTDDEGWRLQLGCCEELTLVGSIRAHHEEHDQDSNLYPQLGSGPVGVRQFYTGEDYREILREAELHHIRVIPEIDLPGHAHAALVSNLHKFNEVNQTEGREAADEVLIFDVDDQTNALSVQLFLDNAVNPCMNGTYDFVARIVSDLRELHRGVQNLTVVHLGGDEIADAWTKSPKCQEFVEANKASDDPLLPKSIEELNEHFVRKSGEVIHGIDPLLDLALWEDGVIDRNSTPYNSNAIFPNDVYAYAWSNIWEWGQAERAYKLANAGYKVVLAHATHLYMDQPYEADPEERGYYWASRYTNTSKVFSYMPDLVYANCDVKRSGAPYSEEQMCSEHSCEVLRESSNVMGMQGALFGETIATEDDFHYMTFPRMLAVAERAWHKADWEKDWGQGDDVIKSRDEDYARFVEFVNRKELAELARNGIKFRISPPGARFASSTKVETRCEFYPTSDQNADDFKIQWRTPGGEWREGGRCGERFQLDEDVIELRLIDSKTVRSSRVVALERSGIGGVAGCALSPFLALFTVFTAAIFLNL